MNTDEVATKLYARYKEMTLEEIVDDVLFLSDKLVDGAFDSGFIYAREKINKAIKEWENKEIMKVLMLEP